MLLRYFLQESHVFVYFEPEQSGLSYLLISVKVLDSQCLLLYLHDFVLDVLRNLLSLSLFLFHSLNLLFDHLSLFPCH